MIENARGLHLVLWSCKKVEQWCHRIDWLEETFSPEIGAVRVSLTHNVAIADCGWDKGVGRFDIRINYRCKYAVAVHFLLHEWAHALTWNERQPDHSNEWGITYAQLYRADEAWSEGMDEREIAKFCGRL